MSTQSSDNNSSDLPPKHPQTSLTAPNDRSSKTFRISEKVNLTTDESRSAVQDLLNKDIVLFDH